ncbi:MAG: hypothetical protein M3P49_15135, partial [Actinomycetota bacterium]|nr:hypothetical protein [Actinomycetota bacterium]
MTRKRYLGRVFAYRFKKAHGHALGNSRAMVFRPAPPPHPGGAGRWRRLPATFAAAVVLASSTYAYAGSTTPAYAQQRPATAGLAQLPSSVTMQGMIAAGEIPFSAEMRASPPGTMERIKDFVGSILTGDLTAAITLDDATVAGVSGDELAVKYGEELEGDAPEGDGGPGVELAEGGPDAGGGGKSDGAPGSTGGPDVAEDPFASPSLGGDGSSLGTNVARSDPVADGGGVSSDPGELASLGIPGESPPSHPTSQPLEHQAARPTTEPAPSPQEPADPALQPAQPAGITGYSGSEGGAPPSTTPPAGFDPLAAEETGPPTSPGNSDMTPGNSDEAPGNSASAPADPPADPPNTPPPFEADPSSSPDNAHDPGTHPGSGGGEEDDEIGGPIIDEGNGDGSSDQDSGTPPFGVGPPEAVPPGDAGEKPVKGPGAEPDTGPGTEPGTEPGAVPGADPGSGGSDSDEPGADPDDGQPVATDPAPGTSADGGPAGGTDGEPPDDPQDGPDQGANPHDELSQPDPADGGSRPPGRPEDRPGEGSGEGSGEGTEGQGRPGPGPGEGGPDTARPDQEHDPQGQQPGSGDRPEQEDNPAPDGQNYRPGGAQDQNPRPEGSDKPDRPAANDPDRPGRPEQEPGGGGRGEPDSAQGSSPEGTGREDAGPSDDRSAGAFGLDPAETGRASSGGDPDTGGAPRFDRRPYVTVHTEDGTSTVERHRPNGTHEILYRGFKGFGEAVDVAVDHGAVASGRPAEPSGRSGQPASTGATASAPSAAEPRADPQSEPQVALQSKPHLRKQPVGATGSGERADVGPGGLSPVHRPAQEDQSLRAAPDLQPAAPAQPIVETVPEAAAQPDAGGARSDPSRA